MRITRLLTLIGCLVSLALPVSAQEQTETPVSVDTRNPAAQATAGPGVGIAPFCEPSLCYGKADGTRQIRGEAFQNATHFLVAGERSELRAALSPTVAPSRTSIVIGGIAGFGIGAVLGTTVGAEACLHEPRWHCAVKVGVPLAAIGVFIGWLHK
jgi:hypothetical protein